MVIRTFEFRDCPASPPRDALRWDPVVGLGFRASNFEFQANPRLIIHLTHNLSCDKIPIKLIRIVTMERKATIKPPSPAPWAPTTSAFPNSAFCILNLCLGYSPFPTTPPADPLQLSSALYKSPLFPQNKPNLIEAKTTTTSCTTKNYANIPLRSARKNKPKTNPTTEGSPEHSRRIKLADLSRGDAPKLQVRRGGAAQILRYAARYTLCAICLPQRVDTPTLSLSSRCGFRVRPSPRPCRLSRSLSSCRSPRRR